MKKFNTTNLTGIIPVTLKDLEFIVEGRDEMIEAIVSMVSDLTTSSSFILKGLALQGNPPTTLTAGWVVLHNQIYRFEEQPYPAIQLGEQRYLRVVESILPEGEKTMKPGMTSVDTWYNYKAEIIATGSPQPQDILFTNLKTFEEIIRSINPITSSWIPITLSNDWEADISAGNSVPSYIKYHNIVYLRGCAIKTGASDTVATLPLAIQPTNRVTLYNNDDFSIETDGTLIAQNLSKIFLDGLVYIIN